MSDYNVSSTPAIPAAGEAMRPRVLTQYGQYERAEWDGVNHSRIDPCCDKVVVLCDRPLDRSAGGIEFTDTTMEGQSYAATTGVMVAVGPQAFAYDSMRLVKWEGRRPQPGSRIFFQKYAGEQYTGADGRLYRLMEDRCVGGIELPETEASDV